MRPGNAHGSFLIRKHDNKGNVNIGHDWYALSVRDGDISKHYKIKTTDSGNYFIARKQDFATLHELIDHYKETADGLVATLKDACKKVGFRFSKRLIFYFSC